MSTYRVTTITLVEADSEDDALEVEGRAGGDIQQWYAEPAEESDHDRLLQAGRTQGSELLGHLAVAVADRETATVDQLVAALERLDVGAWWDTVGGPLLDGLEDLATNGT